MRICFCRVPVDFACRVSPLYAQWGSTVIAAGNLTSETTYLPIAFTTFYKIAGLHQAIGSPDCFDAYIGNKSSVYFKKSKTGSDTFTVAWIAVGF